MKRLIPAAVIIAAVVAPWVADAQASRRAPSRPSTPAVSSKRADGVSAQSAQASAALDSLVSAMRIAYVICPLRISAIVLEYNVKALRGENPDAAAAVKEQYQCTDSARTRADSIFQVAKGAPLTPAAMGMFKDLFAYWRANLSELQPRSADEVTVAQGVRYKARVDDLFRAHREKEERFKLER